MKPVEERITTFIHSTAAAWLLAVIAVVGTWCAYLTGGIPLLHVDKGLGLPSPAEWFASPGSSFFWGLAANLGIMAQMIYINNRFNLLRDITRIYCGMFLLMQMSLPLLIGSFNGGTFVAVVVLTSLIALYRVYNRPGRTRLIFLAFFLVAAGALTQYSLVAYIPIFFMGCAQMRAFTSRTFVASLLGIVTPIWICFSFGIVDYAQYHGPDFESIVSLMTPEAETQFVAMTVMTVATGLTLCVMNLIKVFSYNSRARSYNGFVALLLIATSLLTVVDFTNIPAYLTLLNACTAYQVAQFFIINRNRRSYIVVLGLIAVYLGLYIWWMCV